MGRYRVSESYRTFHCYYYQAYDFRNYYGTGTSALNWRENQFNIYLKPGSTVGSPVIIAGYDRLPPSVTFTNELVTGPPGTGDLTLVYLAPDSTHGFIRGSVGIDVPSNFSIGASVPNSALFIADELIQGMGWPNTTAVKIIYEKEANTSARTTLATYQSPPLSEIIYWFEQRSINMYGELLVNTIGHIINSTVASVLPNYCQNEHGIDPAAVATIDGCGLSPQNRITTGAITRVLYDVRQRAPWFPYYEKALPIINNIRMKSGFISNVLSFSGYVNGKVFSIITNNFNGETNSMREKLYNLLDTLK